MRRSATLREYVLKRNGVQLGERGSMRNMFYRAFGARSFAKFWNHWNPIWGFYLNNLVLRPVSQVAPVWLAILATFTVSGFLHDIAISLVKLDIYIFFTPWFSIVGVIVICTKKLSLEYNSSSWHARALMNTLFLSGSFLVVQIAL